METGAGKPGTQVAVSLTDAVPSFLPLVNGTPIPFELFAYKAFFDSRQTPPGATRPPSLPSAAALLEGNESYDEEYQVPASPASRHAFARCSRGWPYLFECGIALREEAGYAFVASFLHCLPPYPTIQHRRQCYHIHCVPYAPGASDRELIGRLVRTELDALTAGQVSPLNPRIGDLRPLTQTHSTNVRDAVSVTFHTSTGEISVTFWPTQLASLVGPDRRHAIALLKSHLPGGSQGATSSISVERTREAFQTLLSVYDELMPQLPSKRWPAFRTVSTATRFVMERVPGRDREAQAIARILTSGVRRPRRTAFATKALEHLTGLKQDSIGRVIRD